MFRFFAKNWFTVFVLLIFFLPLLDAMIVNAGEPGRTIVGVLMWTLIVACVVTLTLGILGRRYMEKKSQRLAAGLCPACGYDLRATPDRCPECGFVPARNES